MKENYFNCLDIPATTKIINTDGEIYYPELSKNLIHSRTFNTEGVSLAINGGSTRAFTSSIGIFLSLLNINIKNNNNKNAIISAQFISSVSGSSWFVGPYLFSKNTNNLSDKDLLGNHIPLENITDFTLNNENLNNKNFMGKLIFLRNNYLNFFESIITSKEKNIWINNTGKTFLEPYNINKKVVALNSYYAELIKKNNKNIKEVITPPEDSPFWIANSSLMYPPILNDGTTNVSLTPYYSGFPQILGNGNKIVGGNFIETFAYGCNIPSLAELEKSNELKNVNIPSSQGYFTLNNIIGCSSAFYAYEFYKDSILTSLIPTCNLWCLTDPNITKNSYYGDGGITDNTGILALVSRKIKKIISFQSPGSFLPEKKDDIEKNSDFVTRFSSLYGTATSSTFTYNPNSHQIFESNKYSDLAEQLSIKRVDNVVYAKQKLKVLPNLQNGVEGNYELELLIIMVQPNEIFNSQLPNYISSQFNNIESNLYNFPNYPDAELKDEVIDYSIYKSNLLISFIYWLINNTILKELIIEMYL